MTLVTTFPRNPAMDALERIWRMTFRSPFSRPFSGPFSVVVILWYGSNNRE